MGSRGNLGSRLTELALHHSSPAQAGFSFANLKQFPGSASKPFTNSAIRCSIYTYPEGTKQNRRHQQWLTKRTPARSQVRECGKGIITRKEGKMLRHFTVMFGRYFHNKCLSS